MWRLRHRLPLKAQVRVRQQVGVRCDGKWVLGVAAFRRQWTRRGWGKIVRFRITIDSRLPPGEKWEVLVHEYAHCLDQERRRRRPKECHDGTWGRCYSRCYLASLP